MENEKANIFTADRTSAVTDLEGNPWNGAPEGVDTPWFGHTDGLPVHIDYYQGTMFEKVEEVAKK